LKGFILRRTMRLTKSLLAAELRALERRMKSSDRSESTITKEKVSGQGDLKAPSEAAKGSSSNPKAPHDEPSGAATPAATASTTDEDWDKEPGPDPMPYDPMQKFRDGPHLLYGKYPAGLSKSGRKLWTEANLGKYHLFGEGILPFEPIVQAPNAPVYDALNRERCTVDTPTPFQLYGSEEGQMGMALEKEASQWQVKKWLEEKTETEDTETEQTETETEQTEAEDTETETEAEEVGDLMQWDLPEAVVSAALPHPNPPKTAEEDLLDFLN